MRSIVGDPHALSGHGHRNLTRLAQSLDYASYGRAPAVGDAAVAQVSTGSQDAISFLNRHATATVRDRREIGRSRDGRQGPWASSRMGENWTGTVDLLPKFQNSDRQRQGVPSARSPMVPRRRRPARRVATGAGCSGWPISLVL